ncbi:MAG: hypothetical protein H7Y32_07845 [Chloroflexales bacterium]|nr:hypothetical protein [Chloroflexales bacterium]
MAPSIALQRFTTDLFRLLHETFEQVEGIYLDRNTSLFETLATICAEQASPPIGTGCASIAAQVNHVRFYLDVLQQYMRYEPPAEKIDWRESWQIATVTPETWQALQRSLRDSYQQLLALLHDFDTWEGEEEVGGAMACVVHTAYHLGEIRQALCFVR